MWRCEFRRPSKRMARPRFAVRSFMMNSNRLLPGFSRFQFDPPWSFDPPRSAAYQQCSLYGSEQESVRPPYFAGFSVFRYSRVPSSRMPGRVCRLYSWAVRWDLAVCAASCDGRAPAGKTCRFARSPVRPVFSWRVRRVLIERASAEVLPRKAG